MDRARRAAWEGSDEAADHHDQRARVLEGLDKVLPFVAAAHRRSHEAATRPAQEPAMRDWTMALDLVREAAETVRAADARTQDLVQRAHAEMREANARVLAAEARADEAEIRAGELASRLREAEARAAEAEGWLRRLHDAIVHEFFGLKAQKA